MRYFTWVDTDQVQEGTDQEETAQDSFVEASSLVDLAASSDLVGKHPYQEAFPFGFQGILRDNQKEGHYPC